MKYNKLVHDFELTLRRGGVVMPAPDDEQIERNSYNFQLLEKIIGYEKFHLLDVLVMILSNDGSERI
jgi:hypothetical protein